MMMVDDGWCWLMLVDVGWWWLMLVDAGWCWLVMVDDGWWSLMLVDAGWWWLMIVDAGWCWLMLVDDGWWSLMLVDAGWCWLMMVDDGWWSLMLVDAGWWWLMMVDDPWCCLMLVDAGWWSLMLVDDGWWWFRGWLKLQYQDVVLPRCQLWPEHNEDQMAGAAIYWAADVDEHWGLDLNFNSPGPRDHRGWMGPSPWLRSKHACLSAAGSGFQSQEATDFGIPTINLQTIPCLGYPSFTDLNIRAFGLGRRNLHGGRKNQNFEGLWGALLLLAGLDTCDSMSPLYITPTLISFINRNIMYNMYYYSYFTHKL